MKNELHFINSISDIITRAKSNCDDETSVLLSVIEHQNNRIKEAIIKSALQNNNRDIALNMAVIEAYSMETLDRFINL